MNFPEVESKFHLIDSKYYPIVAPYGDWKDRLAALRSEGPTRQNLRRLQRYFVQLYDREVDELLRSGLIEPLYPGC